MTVYRKSILLRRHAYSRLRLIHAAYVDSFEVHGVGNRMPLNRLLFVREDDAKRASCFRDVANDVHHPMRAGRIYFIPCNHLIDLDIEPDLRFFSIQFNFELFYGFDVFEGHPRCETRADPELVGELRELFEREDELTTLFRVNEIVFHFCAQWFQSDETETRDRLTKSRRYDDVLEYVRRSGDAATTVKTLADVKNMREDVFSRAFKRDMGITPKKLLTDMLARKSSERLLEPGVQVKQVAEDLNFSSEYYFSHFFKRVTGESPRAYQRNAGFMRR